MVKLKQMPNQEIVDSLSGSVDFYFWRGIPVARKWPHWPPRVPTPAEKANQDLFGYGAGAWSRLPLIVKQAYKRQAISTSYTGRDLFTVSFINRIWYSLFPPPFEYDPIVSHHWFMTGYDHWWEGTNKHVRITTDVVAHLWCAVSGDYPYSRDRWVAWRGTRRRHGIDVIFRQDYCIEQIEAGDSIVHTFIIRGWHPCVQRYWYFKGSFHENWQLSNTTWFTQHFTEPGPIPGPQTFVLPICWEVPFRRIRCGNHYTFWANDTWYAMVPSADSMTMWKKVGMGMVRQDAAGEPLSNFGEFRDGDSRKGALDNKIHTVGFEALAAGVIHYLWYTTFDLATDTWDTPELVVNPTRTFFAFHDCSISLDPNDVPHVLYNECDPTFPEFWYMNRMGGVWGPAEKALAPPFNIAQHCSIAHDPIDDALHCLCVTNVSTLKYRRRPPGPVPWDDLFDVGTSVNLPMHSLSASNVEPHIAGIPIDWRIDHWEDQPPATWQQDLSLAMSNYANMIERPNPPRFLQIQFRDDDTNLAYIWRVPGGVWMPQVQQAPTGIIVLACTYAHPDVISGVWTGAGLFDLCIWAWYAHWAP